MDGEVVGDVAGLKELFLGGVLDVFLGENAGAEERIVGVAVTGGGREGLIHEVSGCRFEDTLMRFY